MKPISTSAAATAAVALPAIKSTAELDAALLADFDLGSEIAFAALVERHHAAMVRLARNYVSPALAEEVAQEAWIAVIKGLKNFRGQSSFKTWLYRILINRAITAAAREGRANRTTADSRVSEIDAWQFHPDDHPRAGMWSYRPRPWTPEERLLSSEVLECIEREIEILPAQQRQVVTLRDVEGWTSREVCELLGVSETHQRVLLHRARTRLRNALDEFLSRRNS